MRDQAIKDLVGYAVRTGLIEESDRMEHARLVQLEPMFTRA